MIEYSRSFLIFLKVLGFCMCTAVLIAWLYAYRKTGLRGFAYIALSVLIGTFLKMFVFSLLVVATPVDLITLRFTVLPAFSVAAFVVFIYGVAVLLRELESFTSHV